MMAAAVAVAAVALPLLMFLAPPAQEWHQAAVVLAVTVVLAAMALAVPLLLAAHILNLQQDRAAVVVAALVWQPTTSLVFTAVVAVAA